MPIWVLKTVKTPLYHFMQFFQSFNFTVSMVSLFISLKKMLLHQNLKFVIEENLPFLPFTVCITKFCAAISKIL